MAEVRKDRRHDLRLLYLYLIFHQLVGWLVLLVRAGAKFEKGKLIERPDQTPDEEAGEGVDKVAA
jgi:hypothetical protein